MLRGGYSHKGEIRMAWTGGDWQRKKELEL